MRCAQIYFNIFLFATDIYKKSHKLMHTAILSRLRRIWETALANGIEPGAMPPPQPKAVTPAQTQIARRRVKKRIEEPDALMRLPY